MASHSISFKPEPRMITFFRNALSSWITLALFGLILIAFLITGFGTGGSGSLSNLALGGGDIAKIGSITISEAELSNRVNAELEGARQQTPGLTLAEFDKSGGVDSTIDRLINSRTVLAFAKKHGLVISDRLVDSEMIKNPLFKGVTGKFDRSRMLQVLEQRRISEDTHRDDLRASLLGDQIIPMAAVSTQAPAEIANAYANLQLERREGAAVVIATSAYLGQPATAQETEAYYKRNLARYTVPELRSVRYAVFDQSAVAGKAVPNDADLAAAYKAQAERYAGKQMRVLTQVIAPDEAKAKALVAAGAGAFSDAAKKAGLEATTLAEQDKPGFAALSSTAVADAAFAANQGSIATPVKSGLGWHVVRVDTVRQIAGKSLEQAKAELMPALVQRKSAEAMQDLIARIEDKVDDGATFDDVVKAEGLTVTTTPVLSAGGIAPNDPGFKPGAELGPILKDAFLSESDDDATVISVPGDDRHALYDLDKIVPSAPRPLAAIRDQVAKDAQTDRAQRATRKAAFDLAAAINKGTPFAKALATSGQKGATPLAAVRQAVRQAGEKAPPALITLFQLAKGKAKAVEAPEGAGYVVVALERLTPGTAAAVPELRDAVRAELSRATANEYVGQLLTAMKADVGATRNEEAIRRFKTNMLKSGAGQ
jgi:peptidyl-prolyl cis-trans isomerase D